MLNAIVGHRPVDYKDEFDLQFNLDIDNIRETRIRLYANSDVMLDYATVNPNSLISYYYWLGKSIDHIEFYRKQLSRLINEDKFCRK